jgi:nitroreductase
MDALDVLHNRVSSTRMREDRPPVGQMENIFRAALRAADHAMLRPWRFLIVQDEARKRLGELFAQTLATNDPEAPEAVLANARSKPLRAPVVVVAISSPREHPKVPVMEQDLSTGAAVQNMLNAAYAQGLGAIWRTGSMTESGTVRSGLGVENHEKIIGFLYIGFHDGPSRPVPDLDIADFFRHW